MLAAKDRNWRAPPPRRAASIWWTWDYPAEFGLAPSCPSGPLSGCRTRHWVRPVLVTGPENLWFNDPSFIAIEPFKSLNNLGSMCFVRHKMH